MFFSDDFLEEVISRNDIVETISNYIRIEKKGSNYLGLCPFHNEKTPSFSISPSKQIFYCFGCHKGGNVIKFVQEYENIDFVDAVQSLAIKAGLDLPKNDYYKKNKDYEKKARLYEINKLAAIYYYHILNSEEGKIGKQYFIDRGLSPKTIRNFGLGYSLPNRDDLYKFLKAEGYDDNILKESSLVFIEEKGAGDRFFNRVMFPILDNKNRVIAFGARVLGASLPKYLNSSETILFEKSKNLYALNFARLSRKDYYILCEGYMDVIALHQAGFKNAVAALGTAFTSEHALLINKQVKKVVLSFDSDFAGINATKKTIKILRDIGISVKILDLKPYKDPDEFIKNKGKDEFEKRIENAQNSFIWEMKILQKNYNMQDPEEVTLFQVELAKNIAKFNSNIERENYILFIAQEFMIDIIELRNLVASVARGVKIEKEIEENKSINNKKVKKSPIFFSQALIINYMLEDIELIPKIKRYIKPEDFTEGLYRDILELIYREEKINTNKILSSYAYDEESTNLLAEIFNININKENKYVEISESVIKIKKESLERKKKTSNDIKEILEIVKELEELKSLKINLN